jgi:diguanylate cyclase (GGDEF)-like protein
MPNPDQSRSSNLRRWRQAVKGLVQILPECLTILGCLGLIWGAVLFAMFQLRTIALQSAADETAALARAFAESTERINAELDRSLLALRTAVLEKGDRLDLADWVARQFPPDKMRIQVSTTDADGLTNRSTLPLPPEPIRIADREHFRVQLDPSRDVLFISKPVHGRVSGQWTLQYTRKFLGPTGEFAGLGVISAGCEDLSRFYQTLEIGHGFIILAGLDGIVRAIGPVNHDIIGDDLSGDPGFASALTEPVGTFQAVTPWDGIKRIASFRQLQGYPLVVMVGFDDERVFRQYHSIRDRSYAIAAAMSLISLVLGGFWTQQRLRSTASRRMLELTLDNMSQGIAMVDSATNVRVLNRRAVELLGLPQDALGRLATPLLGAAGIIDRSGAADPGDDGRQELLRHGRIIEAIRHWLPDGGQIHTFSDVTERRMAELRIRHLALHDPLTGLPNRVMLHERIAELLRVPGGVRLGLICLDLDYFKAVNNTLGHDAGDWLLQEVSRRLLAAVGPAGLLARTGGDDFAILHQPDQAVESTEALACSVMACLAEPVNIGGTQFRLSASVGVALVPDDATTSADLLRYADTALYQARDRGCGMIVRFDPAMDLALRDRSAIEHDLRQALLDKQVEVWFQPRIETDEMTVSGFEALARWRHPVRGFVPPSYFIPIAEQCGLIAQLGMQVLEQACAFAAELPDGRIAVNLSPVQFRADDLPDIVITMMRRYGLAPHRLELEITEGVLINDEAQALRTLQALHARGLHLSLDDFGTGYASLSYLRRFPFDRIKIDKTFVQAQEHDNATRAIVETMLTMARRLGLAVTVEGVETDEQLALLLRQGRPEAQGYLFGRAMPAAEAVRFYRMRNLRQVEAKPALTRVTA